MQARAKERRRAREKRQEMDGMLKEAYEAGKAWVVKVSEKPLIAIIKDRTLNFMDKASAVNPKD